MSETVTKVVAGITAFVVLLFVAPLFGIAFGAFGGWAVGLFYPNTLHLLGHRLGLDVPPWQLGAMFGFVGGFFKATSTSKGTSK